MSDYKLESSKFHKEAVFTSLGLIGGSEGHKLYGEETMIVQVENVTGGNRITIEGKLRGEVNWKILSTVSGTNRTRVNISKMDYIRFDVTEYSAYDAQIPKIIATCFFSDGNDVVLMIEELKENNKLLNELLCQSQLTNTNLNKMNYYLAKMSDSEDEDF